MEKTIKEKIMKAWADETVIKVIPKVGTYQSPGTGEVLFVSEGKTMFAIWSVARRSRLEYMVDDIADIRFVRDETDGMRTVCGETLAFLKGQIDWNAQDMGSLGEYIKTEYVYNLIDDLEKALTSNKVRMKWPFLEESTQDGANREMDEEDAYAVETKHHLISSDKAEGGDSE